ncbi:YkgJ family cysteine cluster protein [Coralloluteibacterium stylophorae]|uniref:YkgJ family cysteine cluster protein n=1 Tax=Coralloluteibacterium stylophorae TaxID=1776034 RepID=UPI00361F11B5
MSVLDDHIGDDDERIDAGVQCSACDAVCCRLQVVVMPEDDVPRHLVERSPRGLETMARGEDGWCIALDEARMCCSIYSQRPATCRRFVMGSAYCRSERAAYSDGMRRNIPVDLL